MPNNTANNPDLTRPIGQPPASVLAMRAGPRGRANRWLEHPLALAGGVFLAMMVLACLVTLPWTLPLSDRQDRLARHLPPSWVPMEMPAPDLSAVGAGGGAGGSGGGGAIDTPSSRLRSVAERDAARENPGATPTEQQIARARPWYWLGTDLLGRSLLIRCAAGGGISLGIGLCAASISVLLGTLYGSIAGYSGGRVDALMMRAVDVLYGLPYILLVVLLAVAVSAVIDDARAERARSAVAERAAWVDAQLQTHAEAERASASLRSRLEGEAVERFPAEMPRWKVQTIQIVTLFVAIGGVSWLTMARVVRGQVLSLKSQPFVEAARAIGVSPLGIFRRHLLPNLVGPIAVYATLTVPQAILQESFLSFLGIGVSPPIPSWGNLAAEGLNELNPVRSNWWLITFPCLLLGATLLALNFMGEGLREALDPKRAR